MTLTYSELKAAANIAARTGDNRRLYELQPQFERFLLAGHRYAVRDFNWERWLWPTSVDPLTTGACDWPAELTADLDVGLVEVREEAPLIGWRLWSVESGRLIPPVGYGHGLQAAWLPGTNHSDASGCPPTTRSGRHPWANHDLSCVCGFRAVQSATLLSWIVNSPRSPWRALVGAVAQVEMWGRVASRVPIEDPPRTARAEYARIAGPIHLVPEHEPERAELEEYYGIEPGGETLREAPGVQVKIQQGCKCGHQHAQGRAAGLVLVHDGRVLLELRSSSVQHGGTWALPGGETEAGESWRATAVREACEEVAGLRREDIDVQAEHVIACSGGWPYAYVLAEFTGDDPDRLEVGNAESDELRWVHLDGVSRLTLHPALAAAWPEVAEEFCARIP